MCGIQHMQVSVTEEQKQDASENSDSETGSSPQATQADVLMEDAQVVIKMFLLRIMILHSSHLTVKVLSLIHI